MAKECAYSGRTVLSYLTLTAGDKGIKCPSGSPEQCRGGPLGVPPFATMAILSASHATACLRLRSAPPRASGRAQSDAWVGELERRPEVVTCRGKWLAAVAVLPRLGTCRSPGLAGTRGASRRAFPEMPWLAFPASSSCRGLVSSARQPPL